MTIENNDDTRIRSEKTTRGEWVERWKDVVAAVSELPGVWRRRDGGFHVRARTTDPRTNKLREVNRELPNVSRAKATTGQSPSSLPHSSPGTTNK